MSDALSRAEVARIAELAHLELTDAEAEAFTRQLSDILAYATQVQALDTSGVPPTSHVLSDAMVDRDDVETPCLDRRTAVASAPDGDEEAGLFRVPRVIG
jgi:aspartyl-tRNA(Asn)/glutamyl-tRNA(Gln) amidotransferase subunit C